MTMGDSSTSASAPMATPTLRLQNSPIGNSSCDLPYVHLSTQTGSAQVPSQTQSQLELAEPEYSCVFNSGLATPCGDTQTGRLGTGLRHNASAGSLPLHGTRNVQYPPIGSSAPLLGAGLLVGRPVASLSLLSGRSCSTMLSGASCSHLAADGRQNVSESSSAIIPICRICHMPEDESDSMLIRPCRCAGTMQFIHNSCLMKWLEIKTKKSKKPPKCELCRYQYHRHKKFKFHHWRFPRVSQQDKILHIVFIINLIIMIACAIATVLCFLSDKGKITKFPHNKVDLTTEEIVTLSCGVLFFVSFFIAMSVQIKAKHTIYQLFVKFIMQNMEWEIDEYDKAKDSLHKPSSYV